MHHQEKHFKEYTYRNDSAEASAIIYLVFPGIQIAFLSVHMESFDFGVLNQWLDNYPLQVHYCKEGRIEQTKEQTFYCLMPGDCFIDMQFGSPNVFRLPLNHYQGICIGFNPSDIPTSLASYLESCNCSPSDVFSESCIILRSSHMMKTFFQEFYGLDSDLLPDYLKVKIPELFFKLKMAQCKSNDSERNPVTRTQFGIVKEVSDYISQNLHQKITVKGLTFEFGVSDTYLQNAFRRVYGMPVITFIRMQKMQCAARELADTNCTIRQIAEKYGYENESKFSSAFKRILDKTPGQYRKDHSKMTII